MKVRLSLTLYFGFLHHFNLMCSSGDKGEKRIIRSPIQIHAFWTAQESSLFSKSSVALGESLLAIKNKIKIKSIRSISTAILLSGISHSLTLFLSFSLLFQSHCPRH